MLCLLILFTENTDLLVEIFLGSFFITAIISTLIIYSKLNFIKFNISAIYDNIPIPSYSEIIKLSIPIMIGSFLIYFMFTIDTFFIVKYRNFEELAYYGIAVKLSTSISVILTSINTIIAKNVARFYHENDSYNLNDLIYSSSKLNFLLSLPVILVLMFFGNQILLLFGTNYTEAHYALIILAVGQIVSSFCGPVSLYLNMTNKQNLFLFILAISFLLNLVLNYYFVPKYGINGAAIASSISLSLWSISGALLIYFKDNIITCFRLNSKQIKE